MKKKMSHFWKKVSCYTPPVHNGHRSTTAMSFLRPQSGFCGEVRLYRDHFLFPYMSLPWFPGTSRSSLLFVGLGRLSPAVGVLVHHAEEDHGCTKTTLAGGDRVKQLCCNWFLFNVRYFCRVPNCILGDCLLAIAWLYSQQLQWEGKTLYT